MTTMTANIQNTTTENTKVESRCRNYEPDVIRPTDRELTRMGEEDAELLLRAMTEPVEYIDHPTFRNRGTEKALFGENAEAFNPNVTHFAPMPAFVSDSDLDAVEHVSMTTLTAPQEQLLFQRFNFARCKVYRILKANKGKRLLQDQMRSLVAWFKIANAARAQIVQANLHKNPFVSIDPECHEATRICKPASIQRNQGDPAHLNPQVHHGRGPWCRGRS